MAKVAFHLIFICLSFVVVANAIHVPVYSFGKSLPFRPPALKSVKTEEFSNLIQSLVDQDTITVVFVEPKLSINDLTGCKTSEDVTCFKQLSSASEKSYFPNVDNAVDGLYDKFEGDTIAVSENDDILSVIESGKRTIFVNLDMASNVNEFVAHDKLIGDTFATLSKKHNNLLFIYTGFASNEEVIVRKKRAVGNAKAKKNPIGKTPVSCGSFRIAVKNILVKENDGPETSQELVGCVLQTSDKELTVTLKPTELQMVFGNAAGTWYLKKASYASNALNIPSGIYANEGFAYRCGGNLTFTDGKTRISLVNTQTMVSFKNKESIFNLNKIVYCEGFWSPGIVSALFVIFILLIILLTGLSWIMDIRTMDKFDDPKGKTITINATD